MPVLKSFAFAFPFASGRKASPPWWGAVCLRETRDQPKPGYFLEGGRERTLGTRLRRFCDENEFLKEFEHYVCAVHDYVQKVDLSKGYQNPKKKIGGNHAFFRGD